MQILLPANLTGLIQSADYRKIDGGKIWFGEPYKDPRSYPVDTFLDKAMLIPAPPFLAIKLGYLYHNGNVVDVYVNDNVTTVSILITDVYGRQLAYLSNHVVDICGVALPKKQKVGRWWQSKTYPSFEKKDIKLTSKQYPTFKKHDVYLTSTTYPVIFGDEMNLNHAYVNGGTLVGMSHTFKDELKLNHIGFGRGELKSIYQNHTFKDELNLNHISLLRGELVSVYKNTEFKDELSLHHIGFVRGELQNIKITHSFDDELQLKLITCKGGYYE